MEQKTESQQAMNLPDNFGELLKTLRKERGLTQHDLGRKIGVSGASIVHYEAGKTCPRRKVFQSLLRALDVEDSYFHVTSNIHENSQTFGERLKIARKARKLTQNELGEKIGLSGKSIVQYEAGRSYPRHKPFGLLLKELGVSSSYLLTGNKPEEKIKAQNIKEKKALEILRMVNPQSQDTLLKIMEVFLEGNSKNSKKK